MHAGEFGKKGGTPSLCKITTLERANLAEDRGTFSSASKEAGGLAVPRFDLQPFSR